MQTLSVPDATPAFPAVLSCVLLLQLINLTPTLPGSPPYRMHTGVIANGKEAQIV
jgi:hypothetical protein